MDGIEEIIPNANNFEQLSNYSSLSDNLSSYFLINDKVWVFEQYCKFINVFFIIYKYLIKFKISFFICKKKLLFFIN